MIDVPAVLAGDRLALARLLSEIENDSVAGRQALNLLFPHTGRAHLIGITGPPGTGKSSLVNQLARHFRQDQGNGLPPRVAVAAVDPSSPFTGGAVLGDRIRMMDRSADPGVFIRSMATRGSLGGLARATAGVVQAFDAAGYAIILIETVGAGQAEVDIARLAHTTVVVEAPGLGDDIQAIKAGILEAADILVVNKADRPGVDNTERALRGMLKLAHPGPRVFRHHGRLESSKSLSSESDANMRTDKQTSPAAVWIPPVLRTVATDGQGIVELAAAIARHRAHLQQAGELAQRERARLRNELDLRIQERLVHRWRTEVANGRYESMIDSIMKRELSPEQAAARLVKD